MIRYQTYLVLTLTCRCNRQFAVIGYIPPALYSIVGNELSRRYKTISEADTQPAYCREQLGCIYDWFVYSLASFLNLQRNYIVDTRLFNCSPVTIFHYSQTMNTPHGFQCFDYLKPNVELQGGYNTNWPTFKMMIWLFWSTYISSHLLLFDWEIERPRKWTYLVILIGRDCDEGCLREDVGAERSVFRSKPVVFIRFNDVNPGLVFMHRVQDNLKWENAVNRFFVLC